MARQIIPFPQELRPRLPTIVGNVDYLTLQERLQQIDTLLRDGGVEDQFVQQALKGWMAAAKGKTLAPNQQLRFQERSRRALRCTIQRTLLQEDYRGFSCQLAGNPLYQWFCAIDALDQIRVPSKSELQRFAHWLSAEQMREILDGLLQGALPKPQATLREEDRLGRRKNAFSTRAGRRLTQEDGVISHREFWLPFNSRMTFSPACSRSGFGFRRLEEETV